MTDQELRRHRKITIGIAARYLGVCDDTIRDGIVDKVFPFGVAFIRPGNKRYTYYINVEALINYKHNAAT